MLFNTYCFNLFKSSCCFFLLLLLCSTLLSHRIKPLSNTVFVTLTQFMGSDAQRIVGYIDLTKVTPFISLADPILKKDQKKNCQATSYFYCEIFYIEETKGRRYATRTICLEKWLLMWFFLKVHFRLSSLSVSIYTFCVYIFHKRQKVKGTFKMLKDF